LEDCGCYTRNDDCGAGSLGDTPSQKRDAKRCKKGDEGDYRHHVSSEVRFLRNHEHGVAEREGEKSNQRRRAPS
jgi:hypothetical protein